MVFIRKPVELGQRQIGYVEVLNKGEFENVDKILIDGGFNLIGIV